MEQALAVICALGKSNHGEIEIMLRLNLKHTCIGLARNDGFMTFRTDPRVILL